MANKSKIQKNRPISEMIGETEETITMEEIISEMDKKSEETKNERKKQKEQFKKKLQNVFARKDAQVADEKRKVEYLKAISRIEQSQKEEEQEEK